MRLTIGAYYIPGHQSWFKMPIGNDIVIFNSRDNSEMARYDKSLVMVDTGRTDSYCDKIYHMRGES